jgi:hypothetical protein
VADRVAAAVAEHQSASTAVVAAEEPTAGTAPGSPSSTSPPNAVGAAETMNPVTEPVDLSGFTGWVPFTALPAADVPTGPDVYVVVRPTDDPPVFLDTSPAGRRREGVRVLG